MDFKGKNILFIGPMTYQYHTTICDELRKMGARVDFFGENTLSVSYRLAKNFSKKLHHYFLKRYRENIYNSIKRAKYDYVFLIRGDMLSNNFLKEIRHFQQEAQFIMYQWDSVKVFNYLPLIENFDRVFSFDPKDCKEYGFIYLPLFYDHDYKHLKSDNTFQDIDLLFIGALHSDRLKILKELVFQAKENNLISSVHLYMPFFTFIKSVLMDKNFKYNFKYMIFHPFKKKRLLEFITRSKAIVDINHVSQSGYTMRTIETLGAGKKLITTNTWIKNEDFYNKKDISIIDRNNPILDLNFLNEENSNNNYDELYIRNWLRIIFSGSLIK